MECGLTAQTQRFGGKREFRISGKKDIQTQSATGVVFLLQRPGSLHGKEKGCAVPEITVDAAALHQSSQSVHGRQIGGGILCRCVKGQLFDQCVVF